MNILIAANYKVSHGGNFIPSLLELATTLRTQGDTVIFVFPQSENAARAGSWRERLETNGYTVYLVDRQASPDVQLKELNQILNTHHIDILHTHFSMYRNLLIRYRKQIPAKILVHDHFHFSVEESRLKQIVHNVIKSVIYRLLGIGVVAVNHQVGHSICFARHWHVPNGLSYSRDVICSKSSQDCRDDLGIPADEKVCLIFGWSLDVKGLDIAVQAVDQYRKKDAHVLLCIVGFGSAPKQTVIDYIQTRTHVDPHASWIRYLEDTEDIFAYHRAADVYLSTSRTEGFPYAVLEAISQNTSVVVSDIVGTKWALQYEHAFLHPVGDISACANAIEQALAVSDQPSNYQDIANKYSIEHWCDQITNIYYRL